jgi:type VI secretion system protein VasJ
VSVEVARKRALLLAAPLAGAPCGTDARFEPHHEAVRAEVAKLESPAGGPPDWVSVARRGSELLEKQSKDLLIASYTAHALLETEGALGLAVGLTLVNELIEQHWMGLYPPPARMRARSQALAWWLDKTGQRLSEPSALGATTSELLEHIASELERLATLTRAKLDAGAPAVGPVRAALARAKLGDGASNAVAAPASPAATSPAATSPAQLPAAPAPDAPTAPAAPALETAPTTNALAQAPSATPAMNAELAAAAASAPSAAASATPAASPEAQLDAQLDARAAPFLQPIKPDAPAGVDARYDELYTRVRDAIQRLDMPVAHPIDWKEVLGLCESILKTRSKDLLIASHTAYALLDQKRLDGLITGLAIMHGLLRTHWSDLFPDMKRNLKGRSGAISWLLARFERFPTAELDTTERALLPLIDRSVRRLYAAIEELFVDQRPATTPMLTWLERLTIAQASASTSAKPAATPSAAPAKPAQPAQPSAAKPPTAAPAAVTSTVSAPSVGAAPSAANTAELNQFFSRLSNQLWDLATALRKASDRDPVPYRLSRIASYLTLVEAPSHQNRKTELTAPGPLVTGEIEALADKAQWDKLLGAAETTLRRNPYALDMHRLVHTAMGALGSGYGEAQRAVEGELQALLTRIPELVELRFDDDSPFANDATVTWLTSLRGSGGGVSKSTLSGGEAAPQLEELEQARELVGKGRTDEALDVFHAALARLPSGRERFRGRLAMARACASAGSSAMAVALFEGLVADLDRYSVDEWEPALASDCLAGYHQCLKALAATDKEMAQTAAVVYRRLCRVDPKRALSGGAK